MDFCRIGIMVHDIAHGFCLVIVVLFRDMDDPVGEPFLESLRKRIHVSDHRVREPVPAEQRFHNAEPCPERAVAADYPVCAADQVAGIFFLGKVSGSDYDDLRHCSSSWQSRLWKYLRTPCKTEVRGIRRGRPLCPFSSCLRAGCP